MMVEEVSLLYQGLKDAATIVKTVDTAEAKLDLYGKLLDLSSKSLTLQEKMQEMLDENRNLKQQIEELQKIKNIEDDIEYYEYPFITRKSDKKNIKYCAVCWITKHKLIPIQSVRYDNYDCPLCGAHIVDMRNWSENEK